MDLTMEEFATGTHCYRRKTGSTQIDQVRIDGRSGFSTDFGLGRKYLYEICEASGAKSLCSENNLIAADLNDPLDVVMKVADAIARDNSVASNIELLISAPVVVPLPNGILEIRVIPHRPKSAGVRVSVTLNGQEIWNVADYIITGAFYELHSQLARRN